MSLAFNEDSNKYQGNCKNYEKSCDLPTNKRFRIERTLKKILMALCLCLSLQNERGKA